MYSKVVAVTGYAGYIGSILCQLLKEQGYRVIGFDKNTPEIPGVDGTNNLVSFVHTIKHFNIDTIFHLAAKSVPINESMTHPMRYYHNNVGLTAEMIDKLIDYDWKGNVVFASSASVYGYSNVPPMKETDHINPPSHYGVSKSMCEQLFQAATVNDIHSVGFRFFNVAGAYKHYIDKNPHILPKLCFQTYNLQDFTIYGDDYDTPDGTCIRDYVHVLDVCEAMIVAARDLNVQRNLEVKKFESDIKYSVYNLGTQKGTSIKELVSEFIRITELDVRLVYRPRRAGDPPNLVADPSKFIKDYGFTYKHSDIETIIRSAWENYSGF